MVKKTGADPTAEPPSRRGGKQNSEAGSQKPQPLCAATPERSKAAALLDPRAVDCGNNRKPLARFSLTLALLALPVLVQAQFSFTTNGGAITITGYNTAAGRNAVIPAATNGYPVTGIAAFAFSPTVTFFSITNVVIPNSITTIGNYAFYNCPFLTSVTLPGSVTNLGQVPFGYCLSLTNITVQATNPAFSSVGGVLFNKAQTTLIEFPCGLGGIYNVPVTVTNIGFSAFASSRLTSVSIPASVISMNTHALNFCLSLTNISVAAVNPAFSSSNGVWFNKTQTELYQFPPALSGSYTAPGNVAYIGPDAFAYSGVTRVVLPDHLQTIEYEVFYYCTNLTGIIIPGSVTNVGYDAFASCDKLTNAYFEGNAPKVYGLPGSDPSAGTFRASPTTAYYLPGTTGWQGVYGTAPTVLWNPQANNPGFTGGHFGFNLTGPTNAVIVVEACTNLAQPVWQPAATNTFSSSGTSIFSDSQSGNYPTRFYRLRSP